MKSILIILAIYLLYRLVISLKVSGKKDRETEGDVTIRKGETQSRRFGSEGDYVEYEEVKE